MIEFELLPGEGRGEFTYRGRLFTTRIEGDGTYVWELSRGRALRIGQVHEGESAMEKAATHARLRPDFEGFLAELRRQVLSVRPEVRRAFQEAGYSPVNIAGYLVWGKKVEDGALNVVFENAPDHFLDGDPEAEDWIVFRTDVWGGCVYVKQSGALPETLELGERLPFPEGGVVETYATLEEALDAASERGWSPSGPGM